MPSTISAGTTAGTAIAIAGDTSGDLAFRTNGTTTAMTINTSQNVQLNAAGARILNSSGNPILQQTGSVLQVVQSSSTNQTTTTSSNFQATGHSVTITPSSASSKILLLHQGMVNSQAGSVWCWVSIFRNASVNLYAGGAYDSAGGVYTNNSPDSHCPITFSTLDSPNTTSATTYTVYLKNNNNSSGVRYNADGWKLYFIAMEIAG